MTAKRLDQTFIKFDWIVAMVMIMGLALMIYDIAEKKLRYTEDRDNAK
ncbi:MAG: hypothetical protein H0M93_02700 [Methanophagales archaeon]|nr:hypothetical protein [Methanophagales archaeon]